MSEFEIGDEVEVYYHEHLRVGHIILLTPRRTKAVVELDSSTRVLKDINKIRKIRG